MGTIVKMKMKNTVVIRRDYLHYIKKYNRFEKRHRNMSVHMSPCFRDVQVGDVVTVGECPPLQDGQVQHAEGEQGGGQQEVLQEVLNGNSNFPPFTASPSSFPPPTHAKRCSIKA